MGVVVRLVLAMVVMASTSAVTGVAEAAEPMGRERAGRYYLTIACEMKRDLNRFERQVWLGRKSISHREIARRLPEIRRHTQRYALAEEQTTDRLANPPASWPTEVRTQVRRLVFVQNRYVSTLQRASRAKDADGWRFWILAAWRVDFGQHATIIRERLELPPPGKGCGQVGS